MISKPHLKFRTDGQKNSPKQYVPSTVSKLWAYKGREQVSSIDFIAFTTHTLNVPYFVYVSVL